MLIEFTPDPPSAAIHPWLDSCRVVQLERYFTAFVRPSHLGPCLAPDPEPAIAAIHASRLLGFALHSDASPPPKIIRESALEDAR